MENKVKSRKNVLYAIINVSIISIFVFVAKCSFCSEEPGLLPPMDNYEEVEAKILELKEELSYKNKQSAKKTEAHVKNPGTIEGQVRVETLHSEIAERHSEDTIVYLENVPGYAYQPVIKRHAIKVGHIAFTKEKGLAAEPPILDQWNVEFIPHVLPILKGSTVDFPNTDDVRHNVYSPDPIPGTHRMLSLGTYDPDVIKIIRLDKPGEITLRCNVHKEMSAFIVVLDNPYFALTDKTGAFTIDNVPPGNYTLVTWHEKYKPVNQQVTVKPNHTVKVVLPTISERREQREKSR